MKRIRIIGILLTAALALGAVVSASASAEVPELGRCVKVEPVQEGMKKVYHGMYKQNCIHKAAKSSGKYEFLPGPGPANKFTGLAANPQPLLETISGSRITCSDVVFKGEYTGPKSETVQLFFSGCENAAKQPCQTKPATKEGEIESESLEGELGVIAKVKATPAVGWDIKRAGTFATYTCGTLPEGIEMLEGSVIGTIKPGGGSNIDRMSILSLVQFKQTGGKQSPESFEGQPADTLTTKTTGLKMTEEKTGLAAFDEQESGLGEEIESPANQERLEIKAR